MIHTLYLILVLAGSVFLLLQLKEAMDRVESWWTSRQAEKNPPESTGSVQCGSGQNPPVTEAVMSPSELVSK